MYRTISAPSCPVCGHDGSKALMQNSPVIAFLPEIINAPRYSKRQCDKCKTTYFPDCDGEAFQNP